MESPIIQSQSSYLWLIIDNTVATFIIGPLVVFYWRGTWSLLDLHLYPNEPFKGAWICVAIGNGGLMVAALLQKHFQRFLSMDKWFVWLTAYHTYTYIIAFCCVCHWRGIWTSLNLYTGLKDESFVASLITGIVCAEKNTVG